MPSLPLPVSKRRTLARVRRIDQLAAMLQSDVNLGQIHVNTPGSAERVLSLAVQQVLDRFVLATFKPRNVRAVTWGQVSGARAIPRVELGAHSYYPDHIIWKNDFTVAVEVKRYIGHSSTLQQIIGQSVIYSQWYGFALVFIADSTSEGVLARRLDETTLNEDDEWLLSQLWWYHNTTVVCRRVQERIGS